MTDRIRTAPDVRFRPVGVGVSYTFCCARCNLFRQQIGRKLQMVRGTKQYVCAGCAK